MFTGILYLYLRMEFIDLLDDQPSIIGIYDVIVMDINKGNKVRKAFWKNNMFTLTHCQLKCEEYITSWRNSNIIIKKKYKL